MGLLDVEVVRTYVYIVRENVHIETTSCFAVVFIRVTLLINVHDVRMPLFQIYPKYDENNEDLQTCVCYYWSVASNPKRCS